MMLNSNPSEHLNMQIIHAWFEARVAQMPEAIAVQDGTASISYHTLNCRANYLASQLLQAGAQPDMRIALCVPNSAEQIITILAILKSGGAYVPLDPTHSKERLQNLLQESQTAILVTTHDTQTLFSEFHGACLIVDHDDPPDMSSVEQSELAAVYQHLQPQHLAYIIYTSGSTGKPKGVMVEHHSVVDYCRWFQSYTKFSLPQRVDYSNNYIFDFGITSSIVPLMLGATIVICTEETKKDPRSYLNHLESQKITLINITPSFFKEMVRLIPAKSWSLSHLQMLILGGENLPTQDCHTWLKEFPLHVIFNEYGPTEATVAVMQHQVTLTDINLSLPFIPIGQPGPTMQVFVVNSEQQPTAPGEVGELYIGGTCLARGYLNQPELTERQFVHCTLGSKHPLRLYKTGDLVKKNQQGDIEYIGRNDKQVKLRGYRLELSEIEFCLRQHPHIHDAVVVLRNNYQNDPQLVAYYILKIGVPALRYEELQKHIMTALPEFMMPNAFMRLEAFPRTANDKLDERALPEPSLLSTQAYQAPRTYVEHILVNIWSTEINHTQIGIQDNFFELGGHSLQAARIVAKIAQQLNKKVSIHDLYQVPTIEQFAKIVQFAQGTETPNSVPNTSIKKLPLHDFQLLFWLSRFGGFNLRTTNMVWRKRVQGPLDILALNLALEWVIQKQEIFAYHIHLLYPVQTPCTQPAKQFRRWHETSLTHLSEDEMEAQLAQHYDELFYKKTWRAKSIWISADLFYLHDNQIEFQICLSHMVVDESCRSIFFHNLSHAYLFFTKQTQMHTEHALQPYKKYILQHHLTLQQKAEQAAKFWSKYLEDAGSFHIPQQYVLPNAEAQSTQTPISESFITKLRQFSIQNSVAINDVLTAAVSLALLQCCDNDARCVPHKIVIFNTKSTRDDPKYDNTLGCFLRVDPIKLEIQPHATLESLAEQARESAQIGEPFQHASSLVKYAAVGKIQLCLPQKSLKRFFINRSFALLARYFPELNLDRNLFTACEMIAVMDKTKQFLMNINMPKEFLEHPSAHSQSKFCGMPEQSIPYLPFRNHEVKYMLDFFFLRGDDGNKPYIVVTSNLTPEFQHRLGETVAAIIEHC